MFRHLFFMGVLCSSLLIIAMNPENHPAALHSASESQNTERAPVRRPGTTGIVSIAFLGDSDGFTTPVYYYADGSRVEGAPYFTRFPSNNNSTSK